MVYVDSPIYQLGRMKMCHMIADSTAELLAMATAIGVAHRWLQHAGCIDEHFDICISKRKAAIALGATVVTARELAGKVIAKRRLLVACERADCERITK